MGKNINMHGYNFFSNGIVYKLIRQQYWMAKAA